MLKNILNLEGAQKLTKNEQKSINGGLVVKVCESQCLSNVECSGGAYCQITVCNGERVGKCVGGEGTSN
ncbi:hypothetical protein [Flavobacterium sp.]|uniref:hypothetical protein n=1 Tax=Flavobacterium sp. TaxID=239 RepID=UPI002B4AC8F6|nr:hypothetical protein [Flavobacterium sp.]HLF50704.1 hypothetical protein [Flavobacterium sp.]